MVNIDVEYPDKYALLIHNIYAVGRDLGFFEGYAISQYIQDKLYQDDYGDVWIDKHWSESICCNRLYDRRDFVLFQILIFSLKELWDAGEVNIGVTYNGIKKRPLLGKSRQRPGLEPIDHIRRAKRIWQSVNYKNTMLVKLCKKTMPVIPGRITICCACFGKPKRILAAI